MKKIYTLLAIFLIFASNAFAGNPSVIKNAMDVNLREPSTVGSGQTNVTTAGTEVALATSTAILSVTVKAKHANTGMIYVGTNPVTSSTGYVLDAGEAISIDVANLNQVYVDSDVNGEGVSYVYVVE